MTTLPQIQSEEELLRFLHEELAYCGCGYYEEAMRDLRDLLEFAQQRQNALHGDTETFFAITNQLDEWLLRSPGLSSWIVWLLDERGFIWHGKRTSDCYISDKGRLTLDAINRFYTFDDETVSE